MYIPLITSSFSILRFAIIIIVQFDDAILKFNNKTADHLKRKVFMYPLSIPYAVQKYTSFSLVYLIEINTSSLTFVNIFPQGKPRVQTCFLSS